MMRRISRFVLMVLLLSGCSVIRLGNEPNDLVKRAVVGVADDYMQSIARGNAAHVEAMIYWHNYSQNKNVSKDDIRSEVMSMPGRFPIENHPLLGLSVADVFVDDDEAEVLVAKPDGSSQQLKVSMVWTGGGWLIVDDNLFGEEGYLTKLLKPEE